MTCPFFAWKSAILASTSCPVIWSALLLNRDMKAGTAGTKQEHSTRKSRTGGHTEVLHETLDRPGGGISQGANRVALDLFPDGWVSLIS